APGDAGRDNRPRATDPDSALAVIEQAVDAFADGYERAQRLVVRKEAATRREFIDDLLRGRGDPGHLAARSERFGLRLSRAHAVAVAEGPEKYDEPDPVPRQVPSDLFARFENRRVLFATEDGRMVCVAPGDQDDVLTHFATRRYAATGRAQVAISDSGHRRPPPRPAHQSPEFGAAVCPALLCGTRATALGGVRPFPPPGRCMSGAG
ncbi:hypothetical protein ACFU6M_39630, partial [Streptomyces bottropensis]|uniref:hypothetical protein n=1 Tax=Streptomyces bottropensis TaxID=42235 RepID=UPI0036831FF8